MNPGGRQGPQFNGGAMHTHSRLQFHVWGGGRVKAQWGPGSWKGKGEGGREGLFVYRPSCLPALRRGGCLTWKNTPQSIDLQRGKQWQTTNYAGGNARRNHEQPPIARPGEDEGSSPSPSRTTPPKGRGRLDRVWGRPTAFGQYQY